MKRASRDSELGFGSDSFLDIVANMVGILIILIVIAGMRVSKTPVSASLVDALARQDETQSDQQFVEMKEVAASPQSSVAETLSDDVTPNDTAELDVTSAAANSSESETAEPEVEDFAALEQQFLAKQSALNSEVQAVREQVDRQSQLLLSLRSQREALKEELAMSRQAMAATSDEATDQTRQISLVAAQLDQKEAELLRAMQELDQAKQEKPAAIQVGHRLTPISREVTENELHFRLAENRISVVPLEDLVERVRRQIERQRDWLLEYRRHHGSVGPVRGYVLNYIVERQPISILDGLNAGRTAIRIVATEFEVQPQPGLSTESFDEAIDPGSSFLRTLRTADAGTTLTFWVYPDSFSLYRKLQRLAQREGFTVAARPLPFGVPIAGSPNGSRSAGQ